jgi:hypothetical protein
VNKNVIKYDGTKHEDQGQRFRSALFWEDGYGFAIE